MDALDTRHILFTMFDYSNGSDIYTRNKQYYRYNSARSMVRLFSAYLRIGIPLFFVRRAILNHINQMM